MNPESSLALSDIMQIAVAVSDVPMATVFYRDVLGLKFLFAAGPDLAFLAAGGIRIMLTKPEGAGAVGKNSILYFRVPDAASAHAALVARGATDDAGPRLIARMPDHQLWLATVRDPDGNLIGLMEERR